MQVVDKDGNIFGAGIEVTGKDGKPKTTGGGGGYTGSQRKSDYVYPYQYSGTSPIGALITDTNWVIKRIDFTTSGSPITLQATGAWTNRYTLTYI